MSVSKNKRKIAICFFGITRSLTYTMRSIKNNIILPANEMADVRVFAHFFRQNLIDNPRSGEYGKLKENEHILLDLDWLSLEDPEICLQSHNFEDLKLYGDSWSDDFRSLKNLVHQLHSIDRVTDAAISWNPDIYVYARPDLLYHNSFSRVYQEAFSKDIDIGFYPNWQLYGGINDRFFICRGKEIARAYGKRVHVARDFCKDFNEPLHSERLAAYALSDLKCTLRPIYLKATRVRSNGVLRKESFDHPLIRSLKKFVKKPWRRARIWLAQKKSKIDGNT